MRRKRQPAAKESSQAGMFGLIRKPGQSVRWVARPYQVSGLHQAGRKLFVVLFGEASSGIFGSVGGAVQLHDGRVLAFIRPVCPSDSIRYIMRYTLVAVS